MIDELLAYLFNGQPHPLIEPMATWLATSRRFSMFVNDFRAKIRKKLRTTQQMESLLDLRLELESAYLLLQERSLSLAYEPLPIGQSRGPDFSVAYTTSTTFMLEVTRLRTPRDGAQDSVYSSLESRLADMACSKLGQLQLQHGNVLLVSVEGPRFTQDSLRTAMHQLQARAEQNDVAIIQKHGFRDRADFFGHFHRLSELLLCGSRLQSDEPVISWVNPQAKHPLPAKVRNVFYRSLKVS